MSISPSCAKDSNRAKGGKIVRLGKKRDGKRPRTVIGERQADGVELSAAGKVRDGDRSKRNSVRRQLKFAAD